MYWLIADKKILLDKRTITYLAQELKLNRSFVTEVLNKKKGCTYIVALAITIKCTNKRDITNIFEERR